MIEGSVVGIACIPTRVVDVVDLAVLVHHAVHAAVDAGDVRRAVVFGVDVAALVGVGDVLGVGVVGVVGAERIGARVVGPLAVEVVDGAGAAAGGKLARRRGRVSASGGGARLH